jgi:flagellar basal-body rod protein FlgB
LPEGLLAERHAGRQTIVGRGAVDIFARDVTFATLAKSLSAQSRRQTLIAGNIANVNTPGYKRRDIADFSAELADALDSGGTRAEKASRVEQVVAREVVEDELFYRADMGGVDIDREMAELAKSSLFGSAYNQLLQKRISQYRMVIRDGRV